MKALVLLGAENFEIREVETPKPKDDEVLLKIMASGICANDVRDYKGDTKYTMPRIGGHEYSGQIVELGKDVDKSRFKVGQKAVTYIIPACGECYFCRIGKENLCEKAPMSKTFFNHDGISGFGGYAQYIAVKTKDLYVMADDVPYEIASMTEPVACVLNSFSHAKVDFADDVVIIGGGVMGQLHVQLAKMRGARVILSEPDAKRRELAKSFGCDVVFNPMEKNPVEYVKELTQSRGADIVFNTTAIPKVAEQAVQMTAPSGRCIMFSSMHPNNPVPIDAGAVHSQEKVITGSVSPTVYSYHQAVRMISKKLIKLDTLIHKVYPYTQAKEAFLEACKPDTLKVVINFNE